MAREPFADTYGQSANPYHDTARPTPLQRAVAQPSAPQGPSNYPVDPTFAAWRTGGYSAPKHTASNFASSAMPGWDQAKWADPNKQDPKYAVGRLLSNFAPRTENVGAAFAEIAKAYPGATFNGKDTVTIPGVGSIDILEAAGAGGKAWQWAPTGAPTTATGQINPLTAVLHRSTQPSANVTLLQQLLNGQTF